MRRLEVVRDAATVRTDGVTIDVFPDPEGDGTFAVWARFRGSGLLRPRPADRRRASALHGRLGRAQLGTGSS
ncbi:DUF6389 family protein [Streptomyces rubiginosohelvolus]|uniref:DUF6389 family protein n=1 Tax=Streptomyces rubiginosohelvolus TaxID=67362 RepID=UPI0034420D88